jgi:hypothetical protein
MTFVLAKLRRSAAGPALCALIACVLAYTAFEGVRGGWYRWLPGSMSRHRDAVAVAITAIGYGEWRGYASYRKVNRILREHGLSVQKQDLITVGASHYFEVMTDPVRLSAALNAASRLDDPASDGMFYMQDEKGMAIFYLLAFALLGITSSSWFWCYLLIYSSSALVACAAFYRRGEVLFLILAAVCANAAVARLLTTLPRVDINIIDGNRFIGVMAILALFHLMLIAIYRVQPTLWQVAAAVFQTVIICLTVNARTSAVWLPISMLFLWILLWFVWLVWGVKAGPCRRRPVSWPVVVLGLGFAGLFLHQTFGLNPTFKDAQHQEGHVFWHNLVTALHNNPNRTPRYGIPAQFPVYDDQVSYTLFDRELTQRSAARQHYLTGDADWVYRTTSPDLDFRWNAYDSVLRDVFLRTVTADPWYAADSLFVQQPKSALTFVFGPEFFGSRSLFAVVPIVALLCGVLLAAPNVAAAAAQYALMIFIACFGASLPVLSAAVVELRVVELFYTLLLGTILAAAIIVAKTIVLLYRPASHDRRRAPFFRAS